MARPREFDEDQVLDSVLALFWSRGFEATSVQDLVDATGLNRASLYNAFGDKEALYRKVLERYLDKAAALGGLDTSLPVHEALPKLVYGWVDGTMPAEGPRGCFLQQCATAGGDATAQELLAAWNARLERMIREYLTAERDRGAFRTARDPKDLARFLVLVQQGIAASARGGAKRSALRAAVDEAVAHVLGSAPPLTA